VKGGPHHLATLKKKKKKGGKEKPALYIQVRGYFQLTGLPQFSCKFEFLEKRKRGGKKKEKNKPSTPQDGILGLDLSTRKREKKREKKKKRGGEKRES